MLPGGLVVWENPVDFMVSVYRKLLPVAVGVLIPGIDENAPPFYDHVASDFAGTYCFPIWRCLKIELSWGVGSFFEVESIKAMAPPPGTFRTKQVQGAMLARDFQASVTGHSVRGVARGCQRIDPSPFRPLVVDHGVMGKAGDTACAR